MSAFVKETLMRISVLVPLALIASCASESEEFAKLREIPEADDYCLSAQRVVTKTAVPVDLVLHEDFNAFVKSKAVIDGPNGPQIQQFNWYDDDGAILGVSCKLKSADHLNMTFGPDTAGPDGTCQDMNQAVFRLVGRRVSEPAYRNVSFDPNETVFNEANPGMTGPDWLAPFVMTSAEGDTLTIHTKGFIVDFADPAYAEAPERFRGLHYCHLVAPEHFEALLRGEAEPGATVGRELE
jgi:hypothetical protein